jgi:hypothetical protein
MSRLTGHADEHQWDLVVGLTELPLRDDDGRYLLGMVLVIDAELWDQPDNSSSAARDRARLYNTSTLVTLTAGVIICYAALYVINLAWALFVLDPSVLSGYLHTHLGYGDLLMIVWFVASAATVGGALGSGLESDEAIRAAAYSKREEERRNRLANDRS